MLQRKEKQGFQVIPETRENHESGKEFQVKKKNDFSSFGNDCVCECTIRSFVCIFTHKCCEPGIEIVFYDWQGDGMIDHSSIVVGTGNSADGSKYNNSAYGDLVDQNSTDRKQTLWHLDYWNNRRATTEIYAFRLV